MKQTTLKQALADQRIAALATLRARTAMSATSSNAARQPQGLGPPHCVRCSFTFTVLSSHYEGLRGSTFVQGMVDAPRFLLADV